MAIAFRSSTSTSYAARTNTTLTAPAGLANGDILVAAVFVGQSGVSAPGAPTPPAGFTELAGGTGVTDGASFAGTLRVFWKRAASESGSYTFSHINFTTQGVMLAYSGAIASGSPIDVSSIATGTGGTSTATSVTTTAANDMLVYLAHEWAGTAVDSPPSGMTERFDSLVYAADVLQASAGASGTKTQTTPNTGVEPWTAWLVALKPAVAAGKPVKVWSGSAWVTKPVKVWSGSAWVTKTTKVWNGSAWV